MVKIEDFLSNDGGTASLDKTLKMLYEDDKLMFITELTSEEIKTVAIILFLAEYLELPEFKSFIYNVLRLKVSRGRQGRKEFIESFKDNLKRTENLDKIKEKLMTGGV
jgi:hypothetical protein